VIMPPILIGVVLSVGLSVILVHPAKAVEQSEMPFGRNTRVVPSNVALDRIPGLPMEREDMGDRNPSQNLHCKLQPNGFR